MKILFVTDLHGSIWKYERMLEIAKSSGATMVINGGDMYVHASDLETQGKFIRGFLDQHFARFESAGILYACYPGNDDEMAWDDVFEQACEKYDSIISLAQRKFEFEGYEFIGMNWVVDYPFRLKDRCRKDTDDYLFQAQLGSAKLSTRNGWKEPDDWFAYVNTLPTIEEELARLARPREAAKAVYVIHMPPDRLGLDECGHGEKVGSKAVHDFLQDSQPRLSLHGHIHESPRISGRWRARLGNTVCVQPGQLDDLCYVVIDLDTMEMERIVEPPGKS